ITVTITDDGGTDSGGIDTTVQTFAIIVKPVNDPPTLDPIVSLAPINTLQGPVFVESGFVEMNGFAYFSGSVEGLNLSGQLWRSDGTAAGTQLVKDIRPGIAGSAITGITNVGGTLFFSANDGTHGTELWKSDGTALGTSIVKDILPGPQGSDPGS